jgi:hypothetical protein
LSDTTSPSDENHGSGLWLWHGKPPPPPLQPDPRVQQSLSAIFSALRRRVWIALPGGVALTLLAFMLRSTPADKAAPVDTPVAVEPIRSSANTRAVIPAPPANIPAPRVEPTDTQFDQVQMPSAPATSGAEHRPAKKAADYTSARTVRKTHALVGRSSPFVIHGVLTPPDDPTVRHDAGH